MAEQLTLNQWVPGSSPGSITTPAQEMTEEESPADSNYILVTDDTGSLEIAVPAEWEQVDGEIFITGNYEFASIAASSDLAGFADFTTSGTWVLASATLAQSLGYLQNLDVIKNIYTSEGFECVYQDITGDYSDAIYEGSYVVYGNCAGSGNTILILSVRPIENKTDHLITVIVNSPSDESAEQAEIQSQLILDSFNVVGQLP
jgi:serine protease Do